MRALILHALRPYPQRTSVVYFQPYLHRIGQKHTAILRYHPAGLESRLIKSCFYWEMAGGARNKRAKTGEANVPPAIRKAIIEARRNNDATASFEAIKNLLKEESAGVPVDLATVALSTLCEAQKIDEPDAHDVVRSLYEKARSGNANEAFYSTATRAFLRLDAFDKAMEVVEEMKQAGHTPRHRTFSPILAKACESNTRLRTAQKVYKEMIGLQASDLLFEDDVAVVLEACARLRKDFTGAKNGSSSSSSSASVSGESNKDADPQLSDADLVAWVEEVLKDCTRRATEPPSERVIEAAKTFFSGGSTSSAQHFVARPLDAENRCQGCGSVMRSVEPDQVQLDLVLMQTELLAPLQTPSKKVDWDKFLQWEQRNIAKFDTVVDGANISYFRAVSTSDSEPKYEQADLVMKKLKEMGRKPLLFFHARHFSRNGVPRDMEKRWRDEHSLFVVPHGHNDDVFWLHMSLKMGQKNWMVTNDQMRDHRFEMIQSTCAFARWKERHHTAYDVVWNDTEKKLNVQVYPPLKYSVQIQNSDQGKWHFPVRLPATEEEIRNASEKQKLKSLTPGELRGLMNNGKLTFDLYRELRREALGCELPKTYGKRFEWLCLS